MPTPPRPVSDAERAELRRLYLAASPGRWRADVLAAQGQSHLYAIDAKGGHWLLAMPSKGADAELMAAARNALPRLFAAIDALRKPKTLPILGTVGEGGKVTWRTAS